jgi:hypothetical protein
MEPFPEDNHPWRGQLLVVGAVLLLVIFAIIVGVINFAQSYSQTCADPYHSCF